MRIAAARRRDAAAALPPLLAVEALPIGGGAGKAVWRLSFEVREGDSLGIAGPPGAGKTSALRALAGIVRPSGGAVRWRGRNIGGLPPERRCRLGIACTHEPPRPFPALSVAQNALVGATFGGAGAAFSPPALPGAAELAASLEGLGGLGEELPGAARGPRERAAAALRFCGLEALAGEPAAALAPAALRALELARALAAAPRLLLVDDPFAGRDEDEAAVVGERLRRLRRAGLSLVVFACDAERLDRLCHRVIVMRRGQVAAPE